MKPKSAQSKGKRFEKLIAYEIEHEGLGKATRTPGSGSGLIKADIFSSLRWSIECKNEKKPRWWKNIDQAKKQAEMGSAYSDKWLLMVRDPRTPEANPDYYAVVDGRQFLKLLKKDSEPRIKAPDRDLKYKLEHLKVVCQEVIRRI